MCICSRTTSWKPTRSRIVIIDAIPEMVSLELFIDRKNGQSIQFKGFKKSFDAEALLADIKDFIPKQKVVRSCEFATAYSDDLISNLKVLTTKQF